MDFGTFCIKVREFLKFSLGYLLVIVLLMVFATLLYLNSFVPIYSILAICFALLLVLYPLLKQQLIKIYPNILLIAISSTLTLIVVDTVLRFTKKERYYRPHDRFSNRSLEYPELLSNYDSNIIYQGNTYGDLVAMSGFDQYREVRSVLFETDANGYRNTSGQENKKNQYIAIGDSFGVGVGTHQDSTFIGILSKSNTIYNLSFPGDPFQELASLIINYDQIKHTENPTILWFIFTGNDIPDYLGDNTQKYITSIEEKQLKKEAQNNFYEQRLTKIKSFVQRSPLRQIITQITSNGNSVPIAVKKFHKKRKMLFLKSYIGNAKLSKQKILEQKKIDLFKKVFSVAKDFANNKKANLKVFLIPTKYEVYKWVYEDQSYWKKQETQSGFSQVLHDILTELDVDYIDTKPYLIEKAKEKYGLEKKALWWLDDTHFNTEGHKAMSRLIELNLK